MEDMSASSETILEGLDDAQMSAVTALDGPVRIIAGAGAGKTRTVTRRIAYACARGDWDARKVLAVTFSVKAAAEMRARLQTLGVGDDVTAATFHSAALQQLRRVWDDIFETPLPHVTSDQRENVERAIRRVTNAADIDAQQVRDVRAEINWTKVSLVAPDDYPRVCSATRRRRSSIRSVSPTSSRRTRGRRRSADRSISMTFCCSCAMSWMITRSWPPRSARRLAG
mgnify:CR=1 FL=1